jgi:glutamate formiminotransferase/formiminotetrahydrofolate cyclodeaminase
MASFHQMSVSQFLAALASSDPTPGGGTAAAMAGAMGASLLMMVAGLPKTRTNDEAEHHALAAAHVALTTLAGRLRGLADEDSDAYDKVTAAYRLPKQSDAEKTARRAAVQTALREATMVPLDTLQACAEALQHGVAVARNGHIAAASDVAVALGLLEAAANGAAANVRVNIDGLKDPDLQARLAARLDAGLAAARDRVALARAAG